MVVEGEDGEVTGSTDVAQQPPPEDAGGIVKQTNGEVGAGKEVEKEEQPGEGIRRVMSALSNGPAGGFQIEKDKEKAKLPEKNEGLRRTLSGGDLSNKGDKRGSSRKMGNYVRADTLNLADLDAQLEKLHRVPSTNFGNPSSTKRKIADWEIDPTKLLVKSLIAQGTYGTVHRGVYDGKDVAVKLLDWGEEDTMSKAQIESFRNAFKQEVEVWHQLDHPNVTKFIGASMGSSNLQIPSFESGMDGLIHVTSNICCVVVEYLVGGTLKDYLIRNRRRKLPLQTVKQVALDLSRGLEYLHSKKIVHRDVKTENMLLDKQRNVKIADFGVARVEASNPKDMTGETGTLGYMAPEVLNGKPYNRKCDVYSLGICLWEIYCCDMPFLELSFTEMAHAVVHQNLRPTIPRCCPHSLAHVMKKCWDPHPDKRPEMVDVVKMLEAIDTSKGGGMIPSDVQPRGCLPCMRYRGP